MIAAVFLALKNLYGIQFYHSKVLPSIMAFYAFVDIGGRDLMLPPMSTIVWTRQKVVLVFRPLQFF